MPYWQLRDMKKRGNVLVANSALFRDHQRAWSSMPRSPPANGTAGDFLRVIDARLTVIDDFDVPLTTRIDSLRNELVSEIRPVGIRIDGVDRELGTLRRS